jgi:DNA-binding NarL/FixJ family response regulator
MKTLLADDHPLMREGVRQVLAQLENGVEILDAHDYPSLFAVAAAHGDLDLALVDLNMPGLVGMQGISQFRHRFPDIPLVVLSASELPHDIRSALEAGALGYIPKATPTDDMLLALRQVLAGDIYVPACLDPGEATGAAPTADSGTSVLDGFTARQREVARLLGHGFTNKAIGSMLGMSENTVKVHVAGIFRALGVSNRTEAVVAMQRLPPS